MRILCVDDDSIARVIYMQGLSDVFPDDEICIASSGKEALEMADDNPFDVIITDLMMPEISGLELLQKVKQTTPYTEVIMITGKASIGTAVEAMQCGARDYIEKPIDIPLLCAKVENMKAYFNSLRDAEELRTAKEQYEESAGKENHLLEARLQKAENALTSAKDILRTAQDASESDTVKQVLDILEDAS
jgi:DNA-binding NtrC family response regulator